MPIYRIQAPDGKIYRIEGPPGASDEDLFRTVEEQNPIAGQAPKEGIMSAFTGGAKRFGSTVETGLESLIDPNLAAQRGVARSQALGQEYAPATSLDKVKQAYTEKGLFPAAYEAVSQIPGAISENLPNIGATLAGGRTGAMAGSVFGPVGALIGGGIGAATPSLLQLYGSNLERQAQEGSKDVSRTTALGAAVPGAAAEVASTYIPLGRTFIGKLLGPTAEKALAKGTNQSIETAAKESVMATLAKGTAIGAGTEIPTEVGQQMLERLQAGLPLTTPDALKEYGESAYGAALVGGPFGAAARAAGRPGAREEYAEIKQAEDEALREQKKADALKRKEETRARVEEGLGTSKLLALPAPSKPYEPNKDPLIDPVGRFTEDELGKAIGDNKVVNYLNKYRKDNNLPKLKSYSLEDIKDALPAQAPEGEEGYLRQLIAYKTDYKNETYTPQDVFNAAVAKNIATETKGWNDFLTRATGKSDLNEMEQPELHSVIKALDALKRTGKEEQLVLPEGSNASRFTQDQYNEGVTTALMGVKEGKPITLEQARKAVQAQTDLKTDRDADHMLRTAAGNEDLIIEKGTGYQAVGKSGEVLGTYASEAEARRSHRRVEIQPVQTEVVRAPEEAKTERRVSLPEGYEIEKNVVEGDIKPEGYAIREEGSQKNIGELNADEATAKNRLESIQASREKLAAVEDGKVEALRKQLEAQQNKLTEMEAAGQTGTAEHSKALNAFKANEVALGERMQGHLDRAEQLRQPVKIFPIGKKATPRETHTLKKSGKTLGTFPTSEAAQNQLLSQMTDEEIDAAATDTRQGGFVDRAKQEQYRRSKGDTGRGVGGESKEKITKGLEAAGVHTPEVEAKIAELEKKLVPMLAKFGLKDVGLNVVRAIRNNAEGSWKGSDKLIKIALDATEPIKTMRHEALHALKELGFFTPQQWEALKREAKKTWVKQYLEDVAFDENTSRLEAYRNLGLTEEDIIEEAIADAFGAWEGGVKPPPGMMAALFKRMQQFFAALKQALTGAGFDSAEEIFGKIERGELKPKGGLAGEEKFAVAKPGSDIGHKREASSGRYVGAPEWVGSSPQQLTQLRKKLRRLAKEGEAGRYWYERSSKAILDMFGGDKAEAEKFVSLIAIYSPNATVPANTSMALRAYYQYLTGQPISAGLSAGDKKAEDLLKRNIAWGGIKTNSFYQNLMVEIDPSKLDPGVATMDMWMALAFDYGMKALDQGPKYKFAEREIQNIANELGWDAHQVQAAIWTAMKGRIDPIREELKNKELELGIGEMYEDDGKMKYRVKPDRRYDHFRLAHKMGMDYNLTPEAIEASKYDFSDAINQRTAQMSWEATPGASTKLLPGLLKAPMEQKFEYLAAIHDVLTEKDGTDIIANEIGLPSGKTILGFSAWQGDIGAGAQTFTGVALEGQKDKRDVTPEARKLLNLYCAIKGYVLAQEAVVWHVPIYDGATKNQNGIEGTFNRALTADEMNRLYVDLNNKFATFDIAPGYTEDGFRLLNFTDIPNKTFHKGVREILENLPADFGGGMIAAKQYKSVGDYISNDWTSSPRGEDYAEQIKGANLPSGAGGRPNLQQWATDLRTRVEAVNQEFSDKYKWGKPKLDEKFSLKFAEPILRPSPDGGIVLGEKQGKAKSYVGLHYGQAKVDELSGDKYGSGIKGAERRRLEDTDDERIKKRIYFYIPKTDGSMPLAEAGLGGNVYTQQFDNIADGAEVSRLYGEANGDPNTFESNVVDAGYDGYAMPNMGMMVILNHNAPVNFRGTVGELAESGEKLSLPTYFPTAEEAENAAYRKAPPSTPEFKRFFGASKVKDEGRPQAMYHGSLNEITQFREDNRSGLIFVTPSPAFAEEYALLHATRMEKQENPPVKIYPLWVRAETPFDYENPDHVNRVMNALSNTMGMQEYIDTEKEVKQGNWAKIEDPRFVATLKKLGFDSLYVKENTTKNLAVFSANQVKSITGNIGDYSVETKDMRYSLKKVRYSDDRFEKLWDQSFYTQNDAENKTKGYLAFVNPLEFVYATASPDTLERLRKEQEPLDFEKMKMLAPPSLTVSERDGQWKITGHEGRHRMLALHDAGYTEIPVYIDFRSDNAKSIPVKILRAQYADALSATLIAKEVEPLSYANKNKAMEKFTRMSSEVKYSLPKVSAQAKTRRDETTTRREQEGWVEGITGIFKPEAMSDLRANFIHRYNQFGIYDRLKAKRMGGKDLLADVSAEAAANMSDLSSSVTASAFGIGNRKGGIPVYKNGMTTIDTSVRGPLEILSPLGQFNTPEAYQDFQFWAGVQRGVRLNKEGREENFDAGDVALADEYLKAYKAKGVDFKAIRDEMNKFNNGLVNYMISTGVIDAPTGAHWMKWNDYIPFYRQTEGERTVGPKIFNAISGVKPPKELKGGKAPLADYLETIVRNTQAAINAGMKNAAAQKAINGALDIGDISGAKRLDAIDNGPDCVQVLENGKQVSYQVADQLFINAVKSLNMSEMPGLGLLSAPANLLRNLVTKDPGFILANLARDSLSAWVTSGSNATPLVGTVANFAKALGGKSKSMEALLNAGVLGGYEFSSGVLKSGQVLEADLAKKYGTKGKASPLRVFKSVWDGLESATEASDAATRMAVYDRVLQETGNETEAIYRALEVMNFNRKGSSPVARILTAAIPFLNARIQGLDVFYRAGIRPTTDKYLFGRSPSEQEKALQKTFIVRGLTMMALSCAYFLAVSDDDEWRKQEQETKDNYWIMPGVGKFPTPFEVGFLFKTMPERIMAYTLKDDTGEDLRASMSRGLLNTFAFNPIPQVAKPFIEYAANYNFFTGRPIVGQGMEGKEPQFQVGPNTTHSMEWLGKQLGMSPMKLEQVYGGFTGTMGMYALTALDAVFNTMSDSPNASKRFEQLPIVRRFAADPEARGNITQFYELKKAVDAVVETQNFLLKSGRADEYEEFMQRNAGLLAIKPYVANIEKSMKQTRELRKVIQGSEMPADEKRDILTELGRRENALTQNIQTTKKIVSEFR